MKHFLFSMAVLLALVPVNRVNAQSHTYGTWEFDPAYWQACETTVLVMNANPAAADPAFATNNLKTITGTDPLLMTCYTDYTGYRTGAPGTVGAGRSVWVTSGTDLYDFHAANNTAPADMGIRTRQLLGMPSFKENDRVVEMIVKPSDMFRPARNPDMSLTASPLVYPDYADSDRPAFLPTAFNNWGEFKTWMTTTRNAVYKLDGSAVPYPFTQLGYTYDWGSPDSIVGLSEFIIQGAASEVTTVEVHAVVSEQSYRCYYRDGTNVGNFDVFGSLDTIWVGSAYTPVAAAGNRWVRVQAGSTVYQGITVSSEGFVVTNHGTIEGPGKNFDRTLRDSAVEFREGGTLVNAPGAIIDSPLVAVFGTTATDRPTSIINDGSIVAGQTAILTEGGDDVIVNRGTIIGDVSTGEGDDTITLNGGVVTGNIDTGAGTANVLTMASGAGGTAGVRGNILNLNQAIDIQTGTDFLNGTIGTVASPIDVLVRDGATMATETPTNVGIAQIRGALTLEDGATLNIKFFKPAEDVFDGDKVQVTGRANFATGSVIHVDHVSGSRSPIRTDEIFTVLTADGGVYDDSTSNGSVVTGGVSFTTDSAFLGLTSNIKWPWNPANPHPHPTALRLQPYRLRSFESLASGANNRAMAAALDAAHDLAEGDYAVLSNEILFMTEDEYALFLPTLSPAAYHAVPTVARRATQSLAASLSDYLRTRRESLCGPPHGCGCGTTCVSDDVPCGGYSGLVTDTMPPDDRSPASDGPPVVRPQYTADSPYVSARTVGMFFHQNGTEDRVGFESGSPGVQLTFDRSLGYGWIGGLEFDYLSSNIVFKDPHGGADCNQYRVGPYLSWYNDEGFYLDASATYGYHDNDVTRRVVFNEYYYSAHGGFGAHDGSFYLGVGRDRVFGNNILTPTFSLQHIYYGQQDFTETGAAGANLRLAHYDTHSLRSMVGLRAARVAPWGCRRVIPEVFLGWAHEYLANESMEAEFAGGMTPFSTTPGGIPRDSGYGGGGITLLLPRGGCLFTRYQAEVSPDTEFHACDLGLSLNY